MTNRIIFPLMLVTFLTGIAYSQSSHIENPGFGPSSRFSIIKDENVKSDADIEEEKDIAAQKNNPQYQKTSHHQNASVRQFTSSQIQQKQPESIQDFLRKR